MPKMSMFFANYGYHKKTDGHAAFFHFGRNLKDEVLIIKIADCTKKN